MLREMEQMNGQRGCAQEMEQLGMEQPGIERQNSVSTKKKRKRSIITRQGQKKKHLGQEVQKIR